MVRAVTVLEVLRSRYARWITIGQGKGEGGGTPVQIDDSGNILKGPGALKKQGITNLKHFDKTTREIDNAPSRASAKDQLTENLARAAEDWDVDEGELRQALDDAYQEGHERIVQREKAKDALRKKLGVNAGDIARMENAGFDHASDSEAFRSRFPAIAKRMGNADVFASELARDYPELELGDPDRDDVVGAMFERLREGKQDPPAKHDQDLIDHAAQQVRAMKKWRQENPTTHDEYEPIPFRRTGKKERHMRSVLDVMRDKFRAVGDRDKHRKAFDESKVNRGHGGKFAPKGEMAQKAKGAEGVGNRVAKKAPPAAPAAAKKAPAKKPAAKKGGDFHSEVSDIVHGLHKSGGESSPGKSGAKFGDKVFIGHAFNEFKKKNPKATREEFNKQLLDAHRNGKLTLSRADLVGAMNRKDVDSSEMSHPMTGDRLHLIRVPEKPAGTPEKPAAKAPAKAPTKPAKAPPQKPAPKAKPAAKSPAKPTGKAGTGVYKPPKTPPKPSPKPAAKPATKSPAKAPAAAKSPKKAPAAAPKASAKKPTAPKAAPKPTPNAAPKAPTAKKTPAKNPKGGGLLPAAKEGTNKNLWPYVATDKSSQGNVSAAGIGAALNPAANAGGSTGEELKSAAAGITPKSFTDKIAEAQKPAAPAKAPAAAKNPRAAGASDSQVAAAMRRTAAGTGRRTMTQATAPKRGLWDRIKTAWKRDWAKPKIQLREPGETGMLGWARAFARLSMHEREGEVVKYSALDRLRAAYNVAKYTKDDAGHEHGSDGKFTGGGSSSGSSKKKSLFDDHEPTREKKKVAGEFHDNPKKVQKKLLSGLDSLPGQRDLFDNDGIGSKVEDKPSKSASQKSMFAATETRPRSALDHLRARRLCKR